MPTNPLEHSAPTPASDHTPFSVSPAAIPVARSVDVSRRSRTYIVAMAIRMICLALIIVVPGAWKLAALAGALILPLFAVLVANDQAVPTSAQPNAPAPGNHAPLILAAESSQPFITVEEDGTVRESWGGERP